MTDRELLERAYKMSALVAGILFVMAPFLSIILFSESEWQIRSAALVIPISFFITLSLPVGVFLLIRFNYERKGKQP